MATYYAIKITIIHLPIIGELCDANIVISIHKEWKYWSRKWFWKVLKTVASFLFYYNSLFIIAKIHIEIIY